MLGYRCIIAATVGLGTREYRSLWRSMKLKGVRELRLSGAEWALAFAGLGLVVIAAIRDDLLLKGKAGDHVRRRTTPAGGVGGKQVRVPAFLVISLAAET